MAITNPPGPFVYDTDPDIVEILEQYDSFIVALAREKVPRNVTTPETLHMEIDELAQKVRFKFWLALKRKEIANPEAYIRAIVHSQVVDMVRRHKLVYRLPMDEDGELYQGHTLVEAGQGMQNPAEEFERKEALNDYLTKIIATILELPPSQRQAMMIFLKEQPGDILFLEEIFQNLGINIEAINQPGRKDEVQRIRASLSVARKKLRAARNTIAS